MEPLQIGEAAIDDATLLLDEREAVRRAFDAVNIAVLGRVLLLFGVTSGIYAIVALTTAAPVIGAVAGANALACLVLYRARSANAVVANPRSVVAIVLLGQFLLLVAYAGGNVDAIAPWAVMLPFALLFLRFEFAELLALAAALVGAAAAVPVIGPLLARAGEASSRSALFELLVPQASVTAIALIIGWLLTRRFRNRFLRQWQRERDRHLDRLRMKQELEHARDIQLSMLPRVGPSSDWLDVASLSLPATEVGGDYYDYFQLDPHRIAVVVADVAGHGVASGLVLSGVRAGLNMLDGELASPVRTLERLNRMLVRTTPRKMLVTMAVCLFDQETRRARVASAGNPPPLHWSASTGGLRELTPGSLPLGVREDAGYAEVDVVLEAGDALLIHSDGIAETIDTAGEPFGYERLAAAFGSAAPLATAAKMRDALIDAVWGFKGHAAQVDDITMVVLRVR